MKKKKLGQEITKKLEYIGLDLDNIPETLKLVQDMQFKPNTDIDEKNINNIDIFHQKK